MQKGPSEKLSPAKALTLFTHARLARMEATVYGFYHLGYGQLVWVYMEATIPNWLCPRYTARL